jgi:hypothetical protein
VCICVFCISVFFTVLFQHYIHSRATFQYLLQQIATHLFYIWIWIQFIYLLAFGFDSITLTGIWIQFNYLLAFSFDSITLTEIWIELAFFLLSMCISFILFVLSYFLNDVHKSAIGMLQSALCIPYWFSNLMINNEKFALVLYLCVGTPARVGWFPK